MYGKYGMADSLRVIVCISPTFKFQFVWLRLSFGFLKSKRTSPAPEDVCDNDSKNIDTAFMKGSEIVVNNFING